MRRSDPEVRAYDTRMKLDAITLLEDAYRPHADLAAWVQANAPQIIAPFDLDGCGVFTYLLADGSGRPLDPRFVPGEHAQITTEQIVQGLAANIASLPPELVDHAIRFTQRPGAYGMAEALGRVPDAGLAKIGHVYCDSVAVMVPTGQHQTAVITTLRRDRVSIDADTIALWERIAIHLGAAGRLSGSALHPEADEVEAVLAPNGKLLHAEDSRWALQRELLRDGVQRRETARTSKMRHSPHDALELWRGLFAGRWSLIDHEDTDGRRQVLARRNEPSPDAFGQLTRRQRQVLFYASVGWSLKQIAYALGLAEGTITHHLAAGLRKLGLPSRNDLIRRTSEAARAALPGGEHDATRGLATLTTSERTVAGLAARGWSNGRIARERGVSLRTIANQLTSIYRKLGIRDRHELVRELSAADPTR